MRILLLSIALLAATATTGQVALHYPLLEHFTNTRCSLCPGRNALLFNFIGQNPQAFHHISYHPSVPYNNCFLYQHNTAGNLVRQTDYQVNFTPQSYLNGRRAFTGTSLLNPDSLAAVSGLLAPVRLDTDLRLQEALPKVIVIADKLDPAFTDGHRLFVALVEADVFYNAPNGETHHRNVFRQWLTPDSGHVLQFGANNQFFWLQDFTLNAAWNPEKMFALAFVQSANGAAILQSGASYDVRASVSVQGNSAQVNATGGIPPYTFAWPGGQTGTTASGLAAGEQVVRVTDSVGNFYEVKFVIDGANSLPDLVADLGIRLLNDPAGQSLFLQAGQAPATPVALALTDLAGRSLAEAEWPAGESEWSWALPALPKGVYLIRFRAGGKQGVVKWLR